MMSGIAACGVLRISLAISPPFKQAGLRTEDYLDSRRLFGSKEALQASIEELPLYADVDDVSSCPLYQETT